MRFITGKDALRNGCNFYRIYRLTLYAFIDIIMFLDEIDMKDEKDGW